VTRFADLHIHTHFSDSTASPAQVVIEASLNGLTAIAITDHDTVEGIPATVAAAQDKGLEIVPGIELSTEMHDEEIHILGYFFDHQNETLAKRLNEFQTSRVSRVKEILEKLARQGINNITLEEVLDLSRSQSVGRPHLASLLIEKGWVKNMREAFGRFLGEGCPAYVPKLKQTPYEAIDLIRRFGGVAVLAHPMVNSKDELIASFVEAGLGGLEVYYPNCSPAIVSYYGGIAKKHDLIMTGGSDAHGDRRRDTAVGKIRVPYEVVEQLQARAGSGRK
jgi:3',5'-nucleoside bisphosphate phosphatase